MTELKLRYYPDPILREKAAIVEDFDDELRDFADALGEAMYRLRGIGLAAPQVGASKRVIVALQMRDEDDTEAEPLVLVNPRVVSSGGEILTIEEGCLSIPGINTGVRRSSEIEVEYQDLDGKKQRLVNDLMFARVLFHEIDHLNGILFIDYLSTAQKSLIKPRLRELAERQG